MNALIRRLIVVEEDEIKALLWSAAYFFLVLMAYYIIRPVRDDMGVAGGVSNLQWLFTATIVVMFLVNPPYAALVAKLPRQRFISTAYRFFGVNLLIFYLLLRVASPEANIWIGRVFYVWTAVFNLFVVSIFWAFMADIWRTSQSKRLFGFIGVGGTIGAITGSSVTALFVGIVGTANLLLLSAVLLEVALFAVRRLGHITTPVLVEHEEIGAAERPIGGGVLSGITHVLRSPYLLAICAYIMLYTITNTVLYFQKSAIIEATFTDRAIRTAFFAKIDIAVNVATMLTQMFLTGRIIKALGVGLTLGLLPLLSIIGFSGLGLVPTLAVLVVFESLRRAGNYALSRPARETLFTVVSREDKFKAKPFIDTFVYRSGDVLAAWTFTALGWLGLGLAGIAFLTAPLAGLWLGFGLWLGKRQGEIVRGERPVVDAKVRATEG